MGVIGVLQVISSSSGNDFYLAVTCRKIFCVCCLLFLIWCDKSSSFCTHSAPVYTSSATQRTDMFQSSAAGFCGAADVREAHVLCQYRKHTLPLRGQTGA